MNRALVAAVAGSLASACVLARAPQLETHGVGGAATPWTGLSPLEDPDDFRFVVVADRTGGHREGVFESAIGKVNLLQPAFVISVGDLIEGYSEDRQRLDHEWDELTSLVARLEMPFFYLPGNHDISNRVMSEIWAERFGPSYYHFRYKDVLFLGLNSELISMVTHPGHPVPSAEDPASQLAFVERVLAENQDVRWTLVFIHQPLWDVPAGSVHPDWLRVEELLGDRPFTVFAGHTHAYTKERRHDRSYITLATTGGGSGLRGTGYGEFDHVALVTMKRRGPVVANLRLEGIADEDVRTKEVRSLLEELERAVRIESLHFGGARFEGGLVRFTLANPGTTSLEVEGRFQASADVLPQLQSVSLRVAPGEVTTFELPLRAAPGVRYQSIAPALAHWTLRQRAAGGTPLVVRSKLSIMPTRDFALRPGGPIDVDGDLAEWGPLRFDVHIPGEKKRGAHHAGAADASYRFDLRHHGGDLLIAVDVTDDDVIASPDRVARRQDSVMLALDAREDPARSESGQDFFEAAMDGTLAELLILTAAPLGSQPDPIAEAFLSPPPEGVQVRGSRTPAGYAIEIRVPAAALDRQQGRPWQAIRLDINVTDFDAGEPGGAQLYWQPSRFGTAGAPGSGTFVREQ